MLPLAIKTRRAPTFLRSLLAVNVTFTQLISTGKNYSKK
jgi:hypothetical protein